MSTTYTFELTDSSGKEKLTINLTKNLVVRSEWSVIDGNAGHNCLIVDNGVVDDKTVNRLICRSGLEPNIPINYSQARRLECCSRPRSVGRGMRWL